VSLAWIKGSWRYRHKGNMKRKQARRKVRDDTVVFIKKSCSSPSQTK
jgi:hypothetical protein